MSSCDPPVVRIVFQRCTKARLLLTESDSDGDAECVIMNEGLLVFIAFLGDATLKLQKLVNIICNTRICEKDGKYVSILEFPGDILLIPHFCLGGRLKGKQFQYHSSLSKDRAETLFESLFDKCRTFASSHSEWTSSGCRVFAGTFGIRQNLVTHSNGPFTHVVEI